MKIAIDPAYDKDIAIAWTEDDSIKWDMVKIPKEHTNIKTRSLEQISLLTVKALESKFGKKLNLKDTLIVIEGQWFGRNVQVYGQLVTIRSMIHGILIARYPKLRIEIVNPITWQSKILDKKKDDKDTTKIRSINKAFELTNQTLTDDESDAVCMCKYAINYINNEK